MKINKIIYSNPKANVEKTIWKSSHKKIAELTAQEMASRGINRQEMFISGVASTVTASLLQAVVGCAVGAAIDGIKTAVNASRSRKIEREIEEIEGDVMDDDEDGDFTEVPPQVETPSAPANGSSENEEG